MKGQVRWTEHLVRALCAIFLELDHGWMLLFKMLVRVTYIKNILIFFFLLFCITVIYFNKLFCLFILGYLYFSNGARQTEYDFNNKKVIRVLLNYGWLNCY